VLICKAEGQAGRLDELLAELGHRRLTNVLVEGGGRLVGSLLDAEQIDEVHVFIAPKLIGGSAAPGPIAGEGIAEMTEALALESVEMEQVETDIYLRGRLLRE